MNFELITALAAFAFIASITPGPNNLMLMASGANFGFRPTLPHLTGVLLGFMLMLFLVGFGLVRLFELFPPAHIALSIFSVLYLLWLAWKIAHAAPPTGSEAAGRPFTFLQAALFQWVNPKAWTMAMSAITLYAPDRTTGALLLVTSVFGLVNLPSALTWTLLGLQVNRWLSDPVHLRRFNWTMAFLLVASLIPVLAEMIGESAPAL